MYKPMAVWAGVTFLQNSSPLFVGEEHVPVVLVKPGVQDAVASFSAGVAGLTAVQHVAAAHRIRKWTAAPGSGGHPAAGLSIFTARLVITLDVSVL